MTTPFLDKWFAFVYFEGDQHSNIKEIEGSTNYNEFREYNILALETVKNI